MKKFNITQTKLLIDGKFVNSKSQKQFKTINPVTEEIITEVAEANEEDVNLAVVAARKAFEEGPWLKTLSAYDRGQLLLKVASLLEKYKDELAYLESLDQGKPIGQSLDDIDFCIKCFTYYAGWSDKIAGKTINIPGPYFCYTKQEPIGVCGLIVPWNYSIMLSSWKLAAALSCGCTVILKPAEQTPLSVLKLGELFCEAKFPNGVVNILSGQVQTGKAIVNHPDIDKISFTGSTEVGQEIMSKCSLNNLKKVTLELGGKSPLIIFDDFDIDEAVQIANVGIFVNCGQICTASSRIFVHEKIYDKFIQKSIEFNKTRKIGDPMDPNTFVGPLVDQAQFKKVLNYIESGLKENAKLQCGGKRQGNKGFFYYTCNNKQILVQVNNGIHLKSQPIVNFYYIQPTIFSDVNDDMKIAREEIFGPFMSVFKFSCIDEVIKRANNSRYGLAAGVLTNNINTYLKVSNGLKAGIIYVNSYHVVSPQAPFGGFKMSGFGKDLGEESLQSYLQSKCVIVKQPEQIFSKL